MPKYWVVSINPVSPYQSSNPQSLGLGLKAPRACLSNPTTRPTSYCPLLIAEYAALSELPPVAQPLATLVNCRPVSPSRFTKVSALPPSWLPPKANCMALKSVPASASADLTAAAPCSRPDMLAVLPKGCNPTPTIATSISDSPWQRRIEM